MQDLPKVSVKELLGLAIRSEIDSQTVYLKMAERVQNQLLKEKFQILAFEESKHKTILERLHEVLFPREKTQIPDKADEALLPSVHISPSSSLLDILYQAMNSEKSAEEFYANLARRVEAAQRKILEYLSKVEHSHYMMLRSEYTLAQEFEDYGEKDIDKVVT